MPSSARNVESDPTQTQGSHAPRSRSDLPLFHGVPLGIEDLNVVRWTTTRYGSRAVPHLPLPVDDYTVAPLRHAGFVIVGKLSSSEFGAMPVTAVSYTHLTLPTNREV